MSNIILGGSDRIGCYLNSNDPEISSPRTTTNVRSPIGRPSSAPASLGATFTGTSWNPFKSSIFMDKPLHADCEKEIQSLRDRCTHLQTQCSELTAQVDFLTSEQGKSGEVVQKLQTELGGLSQEHKKLKSQAAEFNAQLKIERESNGDLRSKLIANSSQLEMSKKNLSLAQKEVNHLNPLIETLTHENQQLKQRLAAQDAEGVQLQRRVNVLQNLLDVTTNEKKAVKESFAGLIAKFKTSLKESTENLNNTKVSFDTTLGQYKAAIIERDDYIEHNTHLSSCLQCAHQNYEKLLASASPAVTGAIST